MHIKGQLYKDHVEFKKTILALKVVRLTKKLSRKEAAELLGWSARSIEQIENGTCNFSKDRLLKILTAYEFAWKDFEHIQQEPKRYLALLCEEKTSQCVERKPRRNHYKKVTKQVRVIKELRLQLGISQYEASRRCGFVPSGYGLIESGRIELTDKKITHILKSLGLNQEDFDRLCQAPVMREDVINHCIDSLKRMDDTRLESAVNVIKALGK